MNASIATLVTVVAGVAAVLTAVGGVLLVIRTIRSRERIALTKEIGQVEKMLEIERQARRAAELENYKLEILLAEHGLDTPEEQKSVDTAQQKAIDLPKQQESPDKPD